MAEVPVLRGLLDEILQRIDRLRSEQPLLCGMWEEHRMDIDPIGEMLLTARQAAPWRTQRASLEPRSRFAVPPMANLRQTGLPHYLIERNLTLNPASNG